ncbi:nucleotidyltransferase family protein [Micrococcus sp.]|uniref:nucleotidyltransferase family protein n=1 Tax=Micrococcus sp. TaxID=1271 RepID=UPI002A91208F|nr:nucleotidyltransferase domain-containing protein [Micrococcus sp.]MDY6055785.1 nucleotidyltransferase domain-containing protein [Micrococcus sp.]
MTTMVRLDHAAVARAARRHGVERLQIFGSAVTGDLRPDSDVDFLVDFLPGRPDAFEDYTALHAELSRIMARPVDLVVRRAIRNPYFRANVESQAEDVYVQQD